MKMLPKTEQALHSSSQTHSIQSEKLYDPLGYKPVQAFHGNRKGLFDFNS